MRPARASTTAQVIESKFCTYGQQLGRAWPVDTGTGVLTFEEPAVLKQVEPVKGWKAAPCRGSRW
jgi:hypothetical protein